MVHNMSVAAATLSFRRCYPWALFSITAVGKRRRWPHTRKSQLGERWEKKSRKEQLGDWFYEGGAISLEAIKQQFCAVLEWSFLCKGSFALEKNNYSVWLFLSFVSSSRCLRIVDLLYLHWKLYDHKSNIFRACIFHTFFFSIFPYHAIVGAALSEWNGELATC